jgi:hypothetical protein
MELEPTNALDSARKQAEAELAKDRPAKATRALTYVLEELVPIPGTTFRLGVDPFLSLIPGAGQVSGAVFGSVLLFDAARLRMPIPVLARMLGNWAIDWLVGLIPFVGPFLDAAWRSNLKNLRLLNRTIDDRAQVRDASVRYWIAVVAILASMVGLILLVPALLIMWALRALP